MSVGAGANPQQVTPDSAANFASLSDWAGAAKGDWMASWGQQIASIATQFLNWSNAMDDIIAVADPDLGAMIKGAFEGIKGTIFTFFPWFQNLSGLLGGVDLAPTSGTFDSTNAAQQFFTNMLNPTAEWQNLKTLLGGINFSVPTGSFDPIAAGEQFIENVLSLATGWGSGGSGGLANWGELFTELTGSTVAGDNPLEELGTYLRTQLAGPVDPSRLSFVPLGSIGQSSANLFTNPTFDTDGSILGAGVWFWDGTVGHSSLGSVRTTAVGAQREMLSNAIPVSDGQVVNISMWLYWTGLVFTGNPISLNLVAYNGTSVVGVTTLATPNSPAATSAATTGHDPAGWVQLGGQYIVPAGVTAVRAQLIVEAVATAGSVWWDDGNANKSNLLPQSYVSGLLGTVSDVYDQLGLKAAVSTVQGLMNTIAGLGSGATLTDIASRLTHLGTSGSINAAGLTNLGGLGTIPGLLTKAPDLQTVNDNLTNALSGKTITGTEVTGTILDDAKATLANIYSSVSKLTRDVAQLQTAQLSASSGGRQFTVDFSDYPNGGFPAGVFNLTYSGAGTSALGINNGNAVWNMVNNGARKATLIYPTPLLTDYALLRGVMASAPEQGTNVRIWSITRSNAAGTEYVFARARCTGWLTYKGDIGCVNATGEHIWASDVPLTWSLDLRIYCGVGNNPRQHMVLSGDTIVWSGTEPAAPNQSIIDSSHRYWGSITETDGSHTPGAVAGVSVIDNAPPSIVGTTFRASRRSGADITINSGGVMMPNAFFETVDYISPDLTYDNVGNNCRLTVTKAGTYLVQFRVLHGIYASGSGGHGLLWKNGVKFARGHWGQDPFTAGFAVTVTTEDATAGAFTVPLNPGDYINPGMHFTNNMSNTGDATRMADGSESYFTVTRVGVM